MVKFIFYCCRQRDPPVEIKDVVVDLMDGKMLLNLLEVLLNSTLVCIIFKTSFDFPLTHFEKRISVSVTLVIRGFSRARSWRMIDKGTLGSFVVPSARNSFAIQVFVQLTKLVLLPKLCSCLIKKSVDSNGSVFNAKTLVSENYCFLGCRNVS